jgi:Ca2+-binding RTX toxin-like protein
MARGNNHKKPVQEVDPITSFTPDDTIVLETGQAIQLDEGDPPGAIGAFGNNASVVVERGATITGTRPGDVGILSVGADSEIRISGDMAFEGAQSRAASIRDGHISLDGTIEMSGAGSTGFVLNQPTAYATIEREGELSMSGDNSSAVFAFRAGGFANHGSIEASGAYSTGVFAGNGVVENTGSIEVTGDGSSAIYASGATPIVNSGTIEASGEALAPTFGNVGSAAGILLNWDGAVVTNSGRISSEHGAGIEVDPGAGLDLFGFPPPPADTTNTIINESGGVISGEVGIQGSDFVEVVENAGRIEGDVLLGGGDDTYTVSGNGRVDGVIDGGAGDDVIITDHGRDILLGGDGNDYLSGGKSQDVLDGGAGDDVLTGGQGRDLFIYSGGHDTITDFSRNDELELDGFDLDDAEMTIVGDDIVYTFSEGDSLTLEGAADSQAFASQHEPADLMELA